METSASALLVCPGVGSSSTPCGNRQCLRSAHSMLVRGDTHPPWPQTVKRGGAATLLLAILYELLWALSGDSFKHGGEILTGGKPQ